MIELEETRSECGDWLDGQGKKGMEYPLAELFDRLSIELRKAYWSGHRTTVLEPAEEQDARPEARR